MPDMRDQGGLAAVARDVARRAAAVDGGGDEGRDGKKAKKAKKAKKEKKAKEAKKAKKAKKEKRRDGEHDDHLVRPRERDTAPVGLPSRDWKRVHSGEEDGGEKRRGADDASVAALRRLAGDDAADDAIVQEHAARAGSLRRRANATNNAADDENDAPRRATTTSATRRVVEATDRLDAVVDAASRVSFVDKRDVFATLERTPELDERLFRAFGAIAARCASLAKKCVRANAVLLGGSRLGAGAASGLDASRALAEEMRVDATLGVQAAAARLCESSARLYESSQLWDAAKKHNAVVWGRALAACEASEKERRKRASDAEAEAEAEHAFASFYRASVVDAHADDLEALRASGAKHGDVADVGVLLRAIQSGADLVPALQKSLATQFASLKAFAANGEKGDDRRLLGGGAEDDEDASDAEASSEDASGEVAAATRDDSTCESSESDDDSPDDVAEASVSAGGDDEVDYAVTPVAH